MQCANELPAFECGVLMCCDASEFKEKFVFCPHQIGSDEHDKWIEGFVTQWTENAMSLSRNRLF